MNKKKGNRFVKFLIVFFSICLLIFILLPGYVRNALLYQYPNIDDHKIFANRIVEATDPVPLLQSSQYNKNLLPDSLLQNFIRYETVAFIVVQNDSLIHESYYDGFSETSISNCFSATKSIVGLLIGFAIEDGYIKNLDQPVSDFIPEYKTSQNSRLTIRHLLTMSSGIKFSEKYNSLFSPTTKIYYGTDLKEQVQKQMVSHSPGMHFNYISINTQILGTVITEATGKTLSEYASEKLWGPLSASHDAHWSLDKKEGMEKAFCCFNATATDFARIGMLMCDSGVWKGQQVIPRSYYLA
ncbi:MAG: serine hydrolase, partial [Bacteroidales bacterium]|nr:serine hydrolase [Bacteroidales bacterium]